MERSLHIILNPASGKGTGRKNRTLIESELRALDLAYTLVETTRRGDALEWAYEAALEGVDTIVAAGGDGTIHEVVNGLMRAREQRDELETVLGVIPIGTGNDFIKNLTGGTERELAYQALIDGELQHFDLGRVRWDGGAEYFMNAVGTGIDVEVVRQILRLPRLPGVVSYLIGLFRALIRFRPIPLEITVNGETFQERVMISAVGNGFCLGGGFHLFPDAVPDDGLLDLSLVRELSLPQIAVVLLKILQGKHRGHPGVSLRDARSVVIESRGDAPLFFQVDGELREPPTAFTLEIEVEHAVLPVWTGRGARTKASTRSE